MAHTVAYLDVSGSCRKPVCAWSRLAAADDRDHIIEQARIAMERVVRGRTVLLNPVVDISDEISLLTFNFEIHEGKPFIDQLTPAP